MFLYAKGTTKVQRSSKGRNHQTSFTDEKLSFYEASSEVWNSKTYASRIGSASIWKEGEEALLVERRGRACAASGTQKGRKPKLDKQIEEDLIAENQRLRMEIDYLKKLNALVLEEERQNRKHK